MTRLSDEARWHVNTARRYADWGRKYQVFQYADQSTHADRVRHADRARQCIDAGCRCADEARWYANEARRAGWTQEVAP